MHTTNLRKVGGSVMLAVPPALLEVLGLAAGVRVGIAIEGGRLVVEPRQRQRYALSDLLAQCDRRGARSRPDREWTRGRRRGAELI